MRKSCVLIGGSGFLGTNIAAGLLSAGFNVTIVDKVPLPRNCPDSLEGVSFHRVDFREGRMLRPIIKDKDVLIHFAYSSLPSNSMSRMYEDISDNIGETARLLKLAVDNGVGKVVFPSSGGTVYGNSKKLPAKEYFPTNPICSHGITKLAIEKYLFLFNKIFGLDYLIYRIANPYGPGQNAQGEQGLVANVMGRLLNGAPITVFGKGKAVRDYIYVDDVVMAFVSGIRKGLKNDIFNIGTGKGYSINEVVSIISKAVGIKPRIRHTSERMFDVRASILDSGKIKRAIGWKASVSFKEGIEKTRRWIKDLSL